MVAILGILLCFSVNGPRLSGSDGPKEPAAYFLVGGDAQQIASGKKFEIVQKDKRFVPSLVAVAVNTTLVFPNRDAFAHNVYSIEGPLGFFDLGTSSRDQEKTLQIVMSKTGVTKISCAIHPIMKAALFSVSSKYFAVSTDGTYEIDGVKPGKYELMVMDIKGQTRKLKDVTVSQ
jgi:plastocyanin